LPVGGVSRACDGWPAAKSGDTFNRTQSTAETSNGRTDIGVDSFFKIGCVSIVS
jgi:hypothetical protein